MPFGLDVEHCLMAVWNTTQCCLNQVSDVPNFPPYTWFEDDHLQTAPTVTKPTEMYGAPGDMAPDWKLEEVMPELTRRVVRLIEAADEQPFFLYFPLTAPHTPIVPLERFKGMSQAGDYGDYVAEVDWCVGQVMAALDRSGKADDTLVIFTSRRAKPRHGSRP